MNRPQPRSILGADAPMPSHTRPELLIRSGRWELAARGETHLPITLGTLDPADAAREVAETLHERETATGRTHLVCGLIPFDTTTPAALFVTDEAQWRPRRLVATPAPGQGHQIPADPAYLTAVASALEAIADGEVDKVVLARHLTVALSRPLDIDTLIDRLTAVNPSGDTFSVTTPEATRWVGASPELVAEVADGLFLSHPLAGSLPRDHRFPTAHEAHAALTGSVKDRAEHAFVVEHIVDRITPIAHEITTPKAPEISGTDSMWHLGTRIAARLHPGIGALEAALRIHPTPAVCGTPTAQAADLIAHLEAVPRAHYAGLVGWSDSSGRGRWSLTLRCAEISAGSARLFAGAGIVAGSDPASEHDETEAKFATMLRALEGLR